MRLCPSPGGVDSCLTWAASCWLGSRVRVEMSCCTWHGFSLTRSSIAINGAMKHRLHNQICLRRGREFHCTPVGRHADLFHWRRLGSSGCGTIVNSMFPCSHVRKYQASLAIRCLETLKLYSVIFPPFTAFRKSAGIGWRILPQDTLIRRARYCDIASVGSHMTGDIFNRMLGLDNPIYVLLTANNYYTISNVCLVRLLEDA